MFYLLSKTIYLLAMPMTWLLLLLGYAWWTPSQKRRRRVLAGAVLLLFTAANPWLTNRLLLWWEVPGVPYASVEQPYQVGIVLSGAVNLYKGPYDRVHVRKASDRMLHAAELYHRGLVKHLVVTGGYPEPRGGVVGSEAADMYEVLRRCQVPDSAITLEPLAQNTRENAVNAARILQERFPGAGRPLLITSAFHMRRSLACFAKAGVEADPFSVDFYTIDADKTPLGVAFWPTEAAFLNFYTWVHEAVGLAVYKLMGYA